MAPKLKPEQLRPFVPTRLSPTNLQFIEGFKAEVGGNRSGAIDTCITYSRMAKAAGKDVVAVAKKDGKNAGAQRSPASGDKPPPLVRNSDSEKGQ